MRWCLFLLVCSWSIVHGLNNGLGLTPQMGYNSWYDLMCSPAMNENVIQDTAEQLVELGLSRLGYTYVNLDDCWAQGRDANGVVYANATYFPSGIQNLATFVHSRGLSFGIYTDRGNLTCGGRPGSGSYETIDANTYASWGVDYVKEDSCDAPNNPAVAFEEYGLMRDALNKTGRPIFFALCGWEDWYAPQGQLLGNSWRIGPDDSNWAGILINLDIMNTVAQYAGPGGWNDPCLLLSKDWQNNLLVTEQQSRAQFSMWAVTAAPLLISGNVRNMSDFVLQTYSNPEVIAVNQDTLGKAGWRLAGGNLSSPEDPTSVTNVWGRPLSSGSWALVFLNAGTQSKILLATLDA